MLNQKVTLALLLSNLNICLTLICISCKNVEHCKHPDYTVCNETNSYVFHPLATRTNQFVSFNYKCLDLQYMMGIEIIVIKQCVLSATELDICGRLKHSLLVLKCRVHTSLEYPRPTPKSSTVTTPHSMTTTPIPTAETRSLTTTQITTAETSTVTTTTTIATAESNSATIRPMTTPAASSETSTTMATSEQSPVTMTPSLTVATTSVTITPTTTATTNPVTSIPLPTAEISSVTTASPTTRTGSVTPTPTTIKMQTTDQTSKKISSPRSTSPEVHYKTTKIPTVPYTQSSVGTTDKTESDEIATKIINRISTTTFSPVNLSSSFDTSQKLETGLIIFTGVCILFFLVNIGLLIYNIKKCSC